MKQQVIVNILGSDQLGILSEITRTISDASCNILDSRHALYGKDFSLSMIIEGKQSSVTKAEIMISTMCVKHDLLSMLKRTSHHEKQNLEQLINLEFNGIDAAGIIKNVTTFLASNDVSISALRQKTYVDQVTQQEMVKCKMILSAPKRLDLLTFDNDIKCLMASLCLSGKIVHQDIREEHEHIESW